MYRRQSEIATRARRITPYVARRHLRTVFGHLGRLGRRIDLPPAEPWEVTVPDDRYGSVRLTGALVSGNRPEAVIIVHGLGGSSDSGYVRAMASAAHHRGLTALRPNLRGADRLGEDYYHGGLTVDLRAAIESSALSGHENLVIVGFSLGGHLALRYLLEGPDPRVKAVAAISTPLDLAACCEWIDRPWNTLYRRYLLKKLMEIYGAVAVRRPVPLPVEEAARIRSQREFDDRVIAARHGFDGVADYYRRTSVGPHLRRIEGNALLVLTEGDPMIPAASQRHHLEECSPSIDAQWVPGGHVAFPKRLSLGQPGSLGIDEQVLTWLLVRAGGGEGGVKSAC